MLRSEDLLVSRVGWLSVCSAIYRRSHTSLTELLHVTQDKKGFISRTGPALVYQRAVTPVRSPWLFPFKPVKSEELLPVTGHNL